MATKRDFLSGFLLPSFVLMTVYLYSHWVLCVGAGEKRSVLSFLAALHS